MLDGSKILHFERIKSTHLYALDLIESGDISKYDSNDDDIVCVINADEQTNGIGRCSRKWVSIPGNLFVSIVTKNSAGDDLGQLSLAVGCAVRESIAEIIEGQENCRDFSEDKLKLHWPNDVYYDEKKMSGILICQCSEYLVISIGINTNSSLRDFISMREVVGREISNGAIISVLCEQLKKWMKSLDHDGFSLVRSYWIKNVCYIGCNIKVRNGNETISGLFSDIDESGRAVLFGDGRCFFVSSGDLFRNQERIVVK